MTVETVQFPLVIQNIIALLAEQGFDDTFTFTLSERDKNLTRLFCSEDSSDFVALDEDGDAWEFCEAGKGWDAKCVGKPVYQVDAEMIGNPDIDVSEFASKVQASLPGVDVVAITASSNGARNEYSVFWNHYHPELGAAFHDAYQAY